MITDSAMTVPKFEQDKILNTSQDTITRADSISSVGYTYPTSFSEPTFTIGIYSYDGGTTWQDFAPFFNNIGTAVPYQSSISQTSNGSIAIDDQQLSGMGGPYSVLRRWAHIAQPDNSDFSDSVYKFVKGKAYTSKESYMKIAKEGSIDFAAKGVVTISHNLGYIPMVQVWYKGSNGTIGRPFTDLNAFSSTSDGYVKVDENNLQIAISVYHSFPGTAYYRVYYEG